mmetsp:Transcript_18480/g.45358  ORF Transcript_18480/g.45358 Transcript_18480/m.45358 type:complete len:770 (+) Transcript_18480:226-2535(+)
MHDSKTPGVGDGDGDGSGKHASSTAGSYVSMSHLVAGGLGDERGGGKNSNLMEREVGDGNDDGNLRFSSVVHEERQHLPKDMGSQLIHLNIAIQKPSQIVGFTRIGPERNLSDLKSQIIREIPHLAMKCGWSGSDNKSHLTASVISETTTPHCFLFRGAPVSELQEVSIKCKEAMPTICIGQMPQLARLLFQRHDSDGDRRRSSRNDSTGKIISPFMDGMEGKEIGDEFRLSGPNSRLPIQMNFLASDIDLVKFASAAELGDVNIRILYAGKCVKSWKGKETFDFVSRLRASNTTRSPSSGISEARPNAAIDATKAKIGSQSTSPKNDAKAAVTSEKVNLIGRQSGLPGSFASIKGNIAMEVFTPNSSSRLLHGHEFENSIRDRDPSARSGPTLQTLPEKSPVGTGVFTTEPLSELERSKATELKTAGSVDEETLDGKTIRERLRLRRGSWVDITVKDRKMCLWISKALGLHPLTVEDVLEEKREKVEILKAYTFMAVKALRPKELIEEDIQRGEQLTDFMPLRLLLYKDLLVTIHPWKGLFERIRKALPSFSSLSRREKIPAVAKVAYFILDSETEAFVPHVEALMGEVDALENLVYVLSVSEKNDLLRRMALCRRRVAQFNQVIWSKAMIFQQLKSQRYHMEAGISFPPAYLQDILDTITFMTTRLKLAREFLDGAQSTYLARISVEAADNSSEIEERMSTLSSVATIFVPLTTITGMWGMNVVVPGQVNEFDESDPMAYLPFFAIITGMILTSTLLTMLFRKYKLF